MYSAFELKSKSKVTFSTCKQASKLFFESLFYILISIIFVFIKLFILKQFIFVTTRFIIVY